MIQEHQKAFHIRGNAYDEKIVVWPHQWLGKPRLRALWDTYNFMILTKNSKILTVCSIGSPVDFISFINFFMGLWNNKITLMLSCIFWYYDTTKGLHPANSNSNSTKVQETHIPVLEDMYKNVYSRTVHNGKT